MGDAAQNALLKTLEEPIDNRVVILLAENTDNLLPTVLSRVQSLNIDGSDIKILLCEDEKTFLCDKIEKVILAGDIEELFLLSDHISKERVKAQSYLEYLYAYICIRSDEKFGRDVTYAMGAHIKEAIIRIRRNSSVILTVQALLIRLQEEYNAKNSRDSL
ncbi:hypothetical protein SDC9_209839 [bioreactor metagenome]|uniref:Uncharacterized protein n=1 Tax=bioreactor metagenome TaxID=1076179 RepID=A0A645JRK8_9ZZZZ